METAQLQETGSCISLQYLNKISDTIYWNCVRERFSMVYLKHEDKP